MLKRISAFLVSFTLIAAVSASAQIHKSRSAPRAYRLVDVSIDMPIYPNATPANERGSGQLEGGRMSVGRGVSVENLHGRLVVERYVSSDAAEKVLGFYRDKMRAWGAVRQCERGENERFALHLDGKSLAQSCDSSDLGENSTELKVGNSREQHLLIVRPTAKGTDFYLVYVRVDEKPHEFI